MKIAVCVKQVPDATVHKRIDPGTKRLDRSGEAALNPTDLNAVEEALRIKEAQSGEVVLVSLGPEKAVESLRKALAMGADQRGARRRRRGRGLGSARDEPRARGRARAGSRRTSFSSAKPRTTRTAPCSGPPSPTGCACP